MHTQKYGASIRRLADKSIKAKKSIYECPKCNKLKVARKSNAVWRCKACKALFAGGAYSLKTEAGEICSRLMNEYSER